MSKIDFKYKANYYLILLIAFCLPLHKAFVAPLIILFFISTLWNNNFKTKKHINKNVNLFWLVGFYLLYIIGFFYSENKEIALFNLEVKLSLLVFPLSLYFSSLDLKKALPNILKSFIEGCILAFFLAILQSTIKYYYSNDINSFFYLQIANYHHASYIAMYINFSIIILYYYAFNPKKTFFIKPLFSFLTIFFLSFFVILIASKTGLLLLIIIHLFFIFYWILKSNKKLRTLGSLFLIISVGFLVFSQSEIIQKRTLDLINVTGGSQFSSKSSTGIRKQIWNISFSIFKESPIIGHGSGDVKKLLADNYNRNGLKYLLSKKFNAHNQYLQTAIALGSIGLIALLSMLLIPLYFSWKKKHWIYVFFILLTILNFLTEAMLETQSGVIFYAFFNTLFFSALLQEKKKVNFSTTEI